MSTATLSKPGTLVHARGREWVVLPDSTDDLLMARPVGGLDEEITGILPAVEPVESATFRLRERPVICINVANQFFRNKSFPIPNRHGIGIHTAFEARKSIRHHDYHFACFTISNGFIDNFRQVDPMLHDAKPLRIIVSESVQHVDDRVAVIFFGLVTRG